MAWKDPVASPIVDTSTDAEVAEDRKVVREKVTDAAVKQAEASGAPSDDKDHSDPVIDFEQFAKRLAKKVVPSNHGDREAKTPELRRRQLALAAYRSAGEEPDELLRGMRLDKAA